MATQAVIPARLLLSCSSYPSSVYQVAIACDTVLEMRLKKESAPDASARVDGASGSRSKRAVASDEDEYLHRPTQIALSRLLFSAGVFRSVYQDTIACYAFLLIVVLKRKRECSSETLLEARS